LEKQFRELEENRAERKTVDAENTRHGDTDSPLENESAEELSQWDSYIKDSIKKLAELITWLGE
jgi:hypothetical protein